MNNKIILTSNNKIKIIDLINKKIIFLNMIKGISTILD